MKVNVTFRRVFSVDCTAEHVADNWLLYAFTPHKFLVPKTLSFLGIPRVLTQVGRVELLLRSEMRSRPLATLASIVARRMTCGKEVVMIDK